MNIVIYTSTFDTKLYADENDLAEIEADAAIQALRMDIHNCGDATVRTYVTSDAKRILAQLASVWNDEPVEHLVTDTKPFWLRGWL